MNVERKDAIVRALTVLSYPRTPRKIGAMTRIELTTLSVDLMEMERLGMVRRTRVAPTGEQMHPPKGSRYAWELMP